MGNKNLLIMTYAILQHIDNDFIECLKECDYTQEQIAALVDAEGQSVEILANATDYFWDIKLPNGTIVEAISGYNLSDMEDKVC